MGGISPRSEQAGAGPQGSRDRKLAAACGGVSSIYSISASVPSCSVPYDMASETALGLRTKVRLMFQRPPCCECHSGTQAQRVGSRLHMDGPLTQTKPSLNPGQDPLYP